MLLGMAQIAIDILYLVGGLVLGFIIGFFVARGVMKNYLTKNPNGYCHINLNQWKNDRSYDESNG